MVGSLQQRVEVACDLDPRERGGERTTPQRDDPHPETERPMGDRGADTADADKTEGAFVEGVEVGPGPPGGGIVGPALREALGEREHHRQDPFGDRDGSCSPRTGEQAVAEQGGREALDPGGGRVHPAHATLEHRAKVGAPCAGTSTKETSGNSAETRATSAGAIMHKTVGPGPPGRRFGPRRLSIGARPYATTPAAWRAAAYPKAMVLAMLAPAPG